MSKLISPTPRFNVEEKLSRIIRELEGRKYEGGWMCKCPCHPDKTGSLSVNLSDSGKLILYCHAGCSYDTLKKEFIRKDYMPTPKLKDVSKGKKLVAIYKYHDNNGNVLWEKLKYLTDSGKKTFTQRRLIDGEHYYKNILRGIKEVPLYNQNAIPKADTIYIVEGEKDVETLRDHGITAVCNYDGAGKWKNYYNKHFYQKHVVILADNDAPGRAHAERVARELHGTSASTKVVHFPMLPEHGDVTDYLKDHTVDDLKTLVNSLAQWSKDEEIELPPTQKEQNTKARKAEYEDYLDLYREILGEIRVDIFSLSPMFEKKGKWHAAYNAIPVLRSHASRWEKLKGIKFNKKDIEDHLVAHVQEELEPRFIMDIPKWDGKDRIGLFASCLKLSEAQSELFTPEDVDQLLTDWIVTAMRRLEVPQTRPRILVLKSTQKIGKDWFIESLTYGAGQFTIDFHVSNNDKDTQMQLSRGLFLKIPEFDKAMRYQASVLKDMITKPQTDLRPPYSKDFVQSDCRGTFVSSCNNADILRDPTGSTRFIIFDLEKIDFKYPLRSREDGLQVLAQARELGKQGFQCKKESERKLEQYLGDRTPDDPLLEVVELYKKKVSAFLNDQTVLKRDLFLEKGWIHNQEMQEVIKEMSEELECSKRRLVNQLKNADMGKKSGAARGFKIPKSIADEFSRDQDQQEEENWNAVDQDLI